MSKRHLPRKSRCLEELEGVSEVLFQPISYDCLGLDSPWNEGPDRVGEPCATLEVGHPLAPRLSKEARGRGSDGTLSGTQLSDWQAYRRLLLRPGSFVHQFRSNRQSWRHSDPLTSFSQCNARAYYFDTLRSLDCMRDGHTVLELGRTHSEVCADVSPSKSRTCAGRVVKLGETASIRQPMAGIA
jgi:hypothetical protein